MEITKEELETESITEIANVIFSGNKDRGWYDGMLDTPFDRTLISIGAKEMLIFSELAEACEGVRKGLNDDHLPQYKMEDVELADTIIRALDLMGFLYSQFPKITPITHNMHSMEGIPFITDMTDLPLKLSILGDIVKLIRNEIYQSQHYTITSKIGMYENVISQCMQYCEDCKIDIFQIMQDKLLYNSQRADHKRENRLKDGGKKA